MSRRMRILAIAACVGLLGAAAGTAAAFWRGPGAGNGAGAAGTTAAITLTAGSVSADLYPAGTAKVSTTANNTNGASVRIGSLALDTTRGTNGFTVDAAHSGCPVSTFGFTTQSNGGAGWTIPGNGSLAISMPDALAMAANAANACQGVIVTVYLKAQP